MTTKPLVWPRPAACPSGAALPARQNEAVRSVQCNLLLGLCATRQVFTDLHTARSVSGTVGVKIVDSGPSSPAQQQGPRTHGSTPGATFGRCCTRSSRHLGQPCQIFFRRSFSHATARLLRVARPSLSGTAFFGSWASTRLHLAAGTWSSCCLQVAAGTWQPYKSMTSFDRPVGYQVAALAQPSCRSLHPNLP